MRAHRTFLAVLLLAALATSCSKPAGRPAAMQLGASARTAETHVYAALKAPPPPRPLPEAAARRMVQAVDLAITVGRTEAAADSAQRLATALGGYVGHVTATRVDDVMRYELTLRVPSARLDEAVRALKRLAARVESESRDVQDVTDRAVDLEAHLRTLRATERELLALLGESRARGRKAEDVMAVYRELTEIRTQIETLDADRLNLDRQVELTTVRLTVLPTTAAIPVAGQAWRPGDVTRGAVRALVGTLRALANLAIYLVIVVVPVLILLAPVVWATRAVTKRVRSRRSGK